MFGFAIFLLGIAIMMFVSGSIFIPQKSVRRISVVLALLAMALLVFITRPNG